ncbi:MAG: hypothetical protein RI575_14820 [Balneolaceae bacterium]|nr:hypothetical protein [Balneolaceae bacterium]MDR9409118.1 hypothetical protein [Balneolaceae bacterium]
MDDFSPKSDQAGMILIRLSVDIVQNPKDFGSQQFTNKNDENIS